MPSTTEHEPLESSDRSPPSAPCLYAGRFIGSSNQPAIDEPERRFTTPNPRHTLLRIYAQVMQRDRAKIGWAFDALIVGGRAAR